jgi:hypothetical protein
LDLSELRATNGLLGLDHLVLEFVNLKQRLVFPRGLWWTQPNVASYQPPGQLFRYSSRQILFSQAVLRLRKAVSDRYPRNPRFKVYSINWSNHSESYERNIYHIDGLESKRNSVSQRRKTKLINQDRFQEKNLTSSIDRWYTILPKVTIGKTFPATVITFSEGLSE